MLWLTQQEELGEKLKAIKTVLLQTFRAPTELRQVIVFRG